MVTIGGIKYRWRVAFATVSCIAAVALISQVSVDGGVALEPVDINTSSSSAVHQGRPVKDHPSVAPGQGGRRRTAVRPALPASSKAKAAKVVRSVLPTVYVITPTYTRYVQKAELTRLCHTFIRVPKLHWIVVEDSDKKTDLVARLLKRCGVSYTHLNAPTPEKYRLANFKSRHQVPRGVSQRNAALDWLQKEFTNGTKILPTARGVIYFADDDNTYDIQVFEEMRNTKGVSAWPVAFVGGLLVEKPILDERGKVKKWNSVHKPERPYPMDMAGFAINLRLLLRHPSARFTYKAKPAYQESIILGRVGVPMSEFEVKADNATKVYVWHTRAEKVTPKLEQNLKVPSNSGIEV